MQELFGDIGPLKKVLFEEQGVAEVVFVKLADAQRAIENYHNRELDGEAHWNIFHMRFDLLMFFFTWDILQGNQ